MPADGSCWHTIFGAPRRSKAGCRNFPTHLPQRRAQFIRREFLKTCLRNRQRDRQRRRRVDICRRDWSARASLGQVLQWRFQRVVVGLPTRGEFLEVWDVSDQLGSVSLQLGRRNSINEDVGDDETPRQVLVEVIQHGCGFIAIMPAGEAGRFSFDFRVVRGSGEIGCAYIEGIHSRYVSFSADENTRSGSYFATYNFNPQTCPAFTNNRPCTKTWLQHGTTRNVFKKSTSRANNRLSTSRQARFPVNFT